MSYGLNKVMLIGRLGSDPELKYTGNGTPVVSFSVATNESYKNQDGTLVERTEWHRIVAWRKVAEILGQYLKKGKMIYLEGKLQTRDWEDKDGTKRYTTEVVVDDFVFIDASKESGGTTIEPVERSAEVPELAEETKEDDLPF